MTMRTAAGQARELARRCRYLRVAVALWRFARSHSPKWLLPVLAVCAFIPGPFDEAVVLVIVLWPVLRSQASRRELAGSVRKAWRK
jgi:hypothetical protein